jgi:hypothetical protein
MDGLDVKEDLTITERPIRILDKLTRVTRNRAITMCKVRIVPDEWGPPVSGRRRARAKLGERAALGRKSGWAAGLVVGCKRKRAEKEGGGVEGLKEKGFLFFKHTQTMNSNKSLNSNTQNNAPACMQ